MKKIGILYHTFFNFEEIKVNCKNTVHDNTAGIK